MTATGPPAPATDRDSAPWWDALGRHELALQQCSDCGARRWPPRDLCGRCGSLEWRWQRATGTATVASWVVTHHAFAPAWPVPYTVVLARLDDQDDVLLPGAYSGPRDGSDLAVGVPLVAEFEDVTGIDGQTFALLRWRRQ